MLGQDLFCVICNWLFETLIYAIPEDKAYLFTLSVMVMTKFKFPVPCDYAKWRI